MRRYNASRKRKARMGTMTKKSVTTVFYAHRCDDPLQVPQCHPLRFLTLFDCLAVLLMAQTLLRKHRIIICTS